MSNTNNINNHILILEDQRIVGLDLEMQLKRKGYSVSYERNAEDIQKRFLSSVSGIIISSMKNLKNTLRGNNISSFTFLNKQQLLKEANDNNSDTLIIGETDNGIIHFEKPYKVEDIISLIGQLIKGNNMNTT